MYDLMANWIGVLLMGFAGLVPPEKRVVWYKGPHLLLLALGALLVLSGSIESFREKRVAQAQLFEKSSRVEELGKEVRKLQQEAIATLTGGDTVPYVLVSFNGPVANQFMLLSDGDFPLYDIGVEFIDVEKMKELDGRLGFWGARTESAEFFEMGNVRPGVAEYVDYRPDLDTGVERNFSIFIYARNGYFHEALKFRKVAERWTTAYRVYRGNTADDSPAILREWADEEFPRGTDGNIKW